MAIRDIRTSLGLAEPSQPVPGRTGMKFNVAKMVITGAIGLLLLVAILGSFYTINSGRIGVIQTFGRYQEVVSPPGLHWKRPFIDTVIDMDVKL